MLIDNLLGQNHYHNILTRIDGPTTPWFRGEYTATDQDPNTAYHSSFCNLVFKKETGPMGDLFDITLPILLSAVDKQNLQLKTYTLVGLHLFSCSVLKLSFLEAHFR